MKKLLAVLCLFCGMSGAVHADENAYFVYGPLKLTVPFKTADVVYLYDGVNKQSLVGGETTVATVWDRVSGTVGVITSLEGQGAPFIGGDIAIGNALDRFVSLGSIRIGGFGSYDFRSDKAMGGLKASVLLW